jgi:site-specific DNA-cytosine methylase
MASINRLPASYRKLKPGFHPDGGNLYLQNWNPPGSWIFRYRHRSLKKAVDMGLGSLNDVSLAEAREAALENRKLLKQSIDPKARRDAKRAQNIAASAATMTFDQCAEAYVRQHRDAWRNASHAAAWPAMLATYASPVIGWHTPEKTRRLLAMMTETNRAKVDAAKKAGRRMFGGIYIRTRHSVPRPEVRFDSLAGCLRTPKGGSSRQTVMIVEGETVKSRLLSPREGARLMGLPEDYELPSNCNDVYKLLGDGVVVPVVRFTAAHILEPILAFADARRTAA